MTDSTPDTAAKIDHVMRLVELGQLRIGPGNQVNREAVFRLLGFDRPEAVDGE